MRVSSWLKGSRAPWILGGLFVLTQSALLIWIGQVERPWNFFLFQLSVHPVIAEEYLLHWGNAGRLHIAHYYWLDMIHPLVYAFFLRSLLERIAARRASPWIDRGLNLPYAAAAYDYIENICQLPIVYGIVPVSSPLFYLGAIGAYGKWLMVTACCLLLAKEFIEMGREKFAR